VADTIELNMIVKNGGSALARCLRSVAPCVDRMLIGDTGSTDGSKMIAAEFGAEVVSIPWEQDYAKARNRVLAMARCDWILVLDADEMLEASAFGQIRALIAGADAKVGGFDVPRWNYVHDTRTRSGEQAAMLNPGLLAESLPWPAYAMSWNTRLFRRHDGIYFEHCVHETVAGRIDALQLKRPPANFVIHHFGHAEDSEAERSAKSDAYHELGLRKLEAEPKNARAWFEVGLSEFEHLRRPAKALSYFERACALAPGDAAAWLFAGICLVRTGRLSEAPDRLQHAYRLGLRSPVLFEAMGDAHFYAQHYDAAQIEYARAVAEGGVSPLNQAKLGACEVCLAYGNPPLQKAGLERIQAAVKAAPGFAELLDVLTAAALMAGDLPLAATAAHSRLSAGPAVSEHLKLAEALAPHLPLKADNGADTPSAVMLTGR